jgi:HD superfamily phosphodiesterase
MNILQKTIWNYALPYLKQAKQKDCVLHTKGVIKALEMILKKEKADKDILMASAILHDTGWSRVNSEYRRNKSQNQINKELRMHIKMALPISKEILKLAGFSGLKIKAVNDIIKVHKFSNPRRLDKRLLIDADNLSDIFKEQFYSDARSYKLKPEELLEKRLKKQFYTATAEQIFNREASKREAEICQNK